MSTFVTGLGFVSYGAVAAGLAGVVACVLRRWRVAVILSRSAVLAAVGVVILVITVPRWFADTVEPADRAVMLTQGISEAANCAVPAVAAAVVSLLPLVIARRKLRSAS